MDSIILSSVFGFSILCCYVEFETKTTPTEKCHQYYFGNGERLKQKMRSEIAKREREMRERMIEGNVEKRAMPFLAFILMLPHFK